MLDVCLLGSGGMMPLPYRWLTALMMRYNGSSVLIDCGEGTQIAVKEKGWSFKPIDVICFTHFHGDHISGLPGLLLTMGNAERTEPLTLVGPKGLERVVNALRVIAPELPFPIEFIELTKAEEELELNGYHIKAFRVNHNVTCYGYSIEIKRAGKFNLEQAQRRVAGIVPVGNGIAHPGVAHILDAGGDVAYHARGQLIAGDKLARAKVAHLHHFFLGSGGHHPNGGSLFHRTLFDAAENDNALIGIVDRIENQRF